MKKPTLLKKFKISIELVFLFFFFLCVTALQAQSNGTDFTGRLNDGNGNKYLKVQGDIMLIGNSILTPKNKSIPFNEAGDNNELDAKYLDVDGNNGIGQNTFSSSSANLAINNGCKRIVFAGLYWSAMYPNGSSTDGNCFNCGSNPENDWNQVKLRVPRSSNYVDIIADKNNPREVIFKGNNANNFNQGVYVCFKDITNIIQPLADADGEYTVANMRATTGIRRGGAAGGWTLVVIYESPTVSSKYIAVFDGAKMTNVDAGPDRLLNVDIQIDGFQTLPSPFPVNASIGMAALDGDYSKKGDGLLFINGLVPPSTARESFTPISNSLNPIPLKNNGKDYDYPKANFFNASITRFNQHVTNRNPTNENNVGYDIDYLSITNTDNKVIPNGATSGTFRMFTDTEGGDGFAAFLATFAVDIIEPKILLTKEVYDYSVNPPANIGNQEVGLGKELTYEIGFQNQGNDNATNFTITDILPINTTFSNTSGSVTLPDPLKIDGRNYEITYTYDAATRTIVFTIPKEYVEEKDPRYVIRLKVKVVESCNQISDMCSNVIQNIALSEYSGTYNKGTFGDKSLSSYTTCNVGIPQSTNFLVDVDDCKFEEKVTLCGANTILTAADLYESYKWSKSPFDKDGNTSGTILGTNRTLTVTDPGTYYVYNKAKAPCLSIRQSFVVTRFGNTTTNPVLPFASEIVTCTNNGKQLPNIYLCGANDKKDIVTNITDSTNIVWEISSNAAVQGTTCADETDNATWRTVGTGNNFSAQNAGQYRLTINYAGGCFNRFYFNVYKNVLDFNVSQKDIICNKAGNITIDGLGPGYSYSLTENGYYDPNPGANSFNIWQAGVYTVYIKQVGATGITCTFKTDPITIRKRDITSEVFITNPRCYGDKGTLKVAVNDVPGPYTYEIFRNGSSVNKVTTSSSDYTFTNLDGGSYNYTVSTPDCNTNGSIGITEAAGQIKAEPALIKPLTACTNGIIKVVTTQDRNYNNNFSYFVNGSSAFQTSNEIEIDEPGLYTIRVVGQNNCEETVSIQVDAAPKPSYTVTHTNTNCYDDRAEINIALNGPATGYKVEYSINGGATYKEGTSTGATFSNLTAGTYNVLVRFSVTYPINNGYNTETITCPLDPAQTIIITGPTSGVTASAGVGELAGCGPLQGTEPTGLLRITNVEGGTPAYQYSFDGGQNWGPDSQKYVVAGTYNLAVKDALGCVFNIPYKVTLDPKPADPVIDDNVDTVYNCDGSATATVVVNQPQTTGGTTYTYEYYIQKNGTGDFVANTPITNNVFTNVPSGTHNVRVKYNVQTVSSYSNLLQEDFGRGTYTTTPGINPGYCFEDETTTHLDPAYKCNKDEWINDGEYAVASTIRTRFSGSWIVAKDHTVPADPLGRFLCVNVGGTAGIGGILYSKPINDVIPNQPVIISLWAENLIVKTSTSHDDPKLTIQLVNNLNGVGGTETIVATTDTNNPWVVPKSEKWEFKELSLDPGAYNNLSFVVRSYSNEFNGNDVLIDDIWVRQIPKSCGNERTFPIEIDGSKAFNAGKPQVQDVSCNGANDGSITITATNFDTATGFYYSTDNGVTWNTSTTSPVTVPGLEAGTYQVIVKNDVAGTTCSYSFISEIKAPAALVATAVEQTPPTCTEGATIQASATGGTGLYEFELRKADGKTVVTAFSNNGGTFTDVPAGTYTVVARDVPNGCTSPASATITVTDPTPPTATLASTSNLCYNATDGATLVVNVTGGNGTLSYSLDGAPGQTAVNSYTFTNVGVGNHTIVVTDSKNCYDTINNIVVAPQLGATVNSVTELACNPAADAVITIGITGGTQPYTYTVNGGSSSTLAAGISTISYPTAVSGTYNFAITDASGCTTTAQAQVATITLPTVSATPTQVSCNGGNNGQVILAGNGGSGNYTYSFNGSAFTTTTTYPGLSADVTYNFAVRDSKGCEGTGTITLTQPSALTTTASVTTPLSCNTSNAKQSAVVTVVPPTTGTSPYTYTFNGITTGSNTYTVSDNGTNQTINIVVTDANGCPFNTSVVVNGLNPPTDLTFAAAAITCNAPQTTLTLTATNGVAPLTYSITSPVGAVTSNTTGSFANLAPGTYNFRVTDANGCYYEESHTINAVTPIALSANSTNVLCNGDATGTATFTVSGFSGTYSYTVNNGTAVTAQTAGTFTLNNLSAGTYNVVVTDNTTGCDATREVTMAQPTALTLNASGTNVNCNNDQSQITGTASEGTAGYTYAAVITGQPEPTAFAANPIIVDTNSGANLVWDVWAKDANGCTVMTTVTITLDAAPTVIAVLDNQCTATSNNGFTITATGTGGVLPLEYSIDGVSFQSSDTFTVNSRTAPYVVTVRDANGCTNTAAALTVYPRLSANAQVSRELSCSPTAPEAEITITASGGRVSYTYEVSTNGGISYTPMPTNVYTTATAGSYSFRITDSNSPACQTIATAEVQAITDPKVAIASQVKVSCNGGNNGSVTLQGSGGSGGFTYSNNATSGFTTNPTFNNLSASDTPYTFYVKDSKGCVGQVDVTITEPTQLVADAVEVGFTCNPTNGSTKIAGTVTINVTAGTGTAPYRYRFNGTGSFTTNNVLTLNDNGLDQPYSYEVQDANGCTISGSGTLERLNPPTISGISGSSITCNTTESTVTVTRTAGTGVLPLAYSIVTGPVVNNTGATTGVFTGLTPGLYTFRVTDANGCYATQSYRVNDKIQVTAVLSAKTDVACYGFSTGSARFTIGNLVGTAAESLTNNDTGATYTPSATGTNTYTYSNLPAGNNYTFTVTDDGTGCTATAPVTIIAPTTAVTASLDPVVNANCKTPYAVVTINALGGTPNYKYAFVHDGVTPTDSDYVSGTNRYVANLDPAEATAWDVWVKDANGCTIATPIDVTITTDDVPVLSLDVTNQCLASGNTFTIEATNTIGVAPFVYTINTAFAPTGTNNNIFTVAPGTYQVTVTDANGCTDTESITVSPAINPVATLVKDLTCEVGNENALISVVINGGLADFTYAVKYNGGTYGATTTVTGNTFTYTATAAGTYQFLITDANGCPKETNVITITTPVIVAGTGVGVDPTCNGYNDGSITLTATAGEAPFEYSINNGLTFVDTNIFGGLTAGTYTYVIRDAKGCPFSDDVTLTDPAAIVAVIQTNDIQCNAADVPGSIQINDITGGSAPFTVSLLNASHTVLRTEVLTTLPTPTVPYVFSNALDFGDYYVTVVDSKGCEFTSEKQRINTVPYLKFLPPSIGGTCEIGATVNLALDTAYPSAPDYIYSIYGGVSQAPTSSTTAQFTGLNFGQTYYFQVLDNNLCTSIVEVKIPALSDIKINPITTTNVTCNTSPATTNGTVNFTVSEFGAGTTSLKFEVLDQLTNLPLTTPVVKSPIDVTGLTSISDSFTGLAAGSYTIRVTELDGTKCTSSESFEISQPTQPVNLSIVSNVNATCDKPAQVRVTTTGGTGPYIYSAVAGTTTVNSSTNVLELDYNVNTTWTITVTDANGCTDSETVTIAKDPEPEIDLSVVNKCVAEDTFAIEVTQVTAGMGTYSISLDNSTFSPITGLPYIVSGLHSGPHTIVIKDANGCIDSKPITIDEPLIATPALTALPICAINDGVITMSGTGGTGNYTYGISPSPVGVTINQTTGVISGLPAGTYTVTMTDTATPTNCSTTAIVTLSAPTPVTFTATTIAPLCPTDANGSITVILDATNNNPNYTYEIMVGPVTRPAQSSNVFNGLPAGTYTVQVNSGRGCSETEDVTIIDPSPVIASAILTQALTCGTANSTNKATITASASGGAGGYTYGTDGIEFSSQNVFETYDSGNFTIWAKDANGCIDSETINIPALDPPTDMDITGTPIYCVVQGAGGPTSTVALSNVQNGAGTVTTGLTYQMIAPSFLENNTNPVFAGLLPGTYLFQVTDANGCTYTESYTVENVTNITVSGQVTADVACYNGNNGEAVFTVGDFTGSYTPALTTGTGTLTQTGNIITLTDLIAGSYTVTVTDDTTGCTDDFTVTIAQPTAPLSVVGSQVKAANCNFGAKVTAVANGGTPNYKYAYGLTAASILPAPSDYSTSPDAVLDYSLGSDWTVYVIDANGCTTQDNFSITLDSEPTINAFTATVCYDGSPVNITLTGSNGVAPYEFSIGNTYNSTGNFTLNAPGTYKFYIKDANGCVNSTTYTFNQQLLLEASLTQDITCFASPDAVVTLQATQGSGTYTTYEVSSNNGSTWNATTAGTTHTIVANAPGTYIFRVTDDQGCTALSRVITASPQTTPTFTQTQVNVSCFGGNNGSITVTAANGLAPYEYSKDNGVTWQSSNLFTGLNDAGVYNVVVRDAKGCLSTAQVVDITQPLELAATIDVTTPLSCGAGNAAQQAVVTVTVDPATGTAPYQFSFNGTDFTGSNTGTPNTFEYKTTTAGPVTIYVRDANGCTIPAAVSTTIDDLNPPAIASITGTDIWCAPSTSTTSTVTVTATTGTGVGALEYTILEPTVVSNGTNPEFTGLTAGTYLFQVKDENDCTATQYYEVKQLVNITVNGQQTQAVSCIGQSNGTLEFKVANNAGAFTAVLNPSLGNQTISGDTVTITDLPAGSYTLNITDNVTGCAASAPATVTEPTAVQLTLGPVINATCNTDATVTVQATGGTPGYKYAFVQDSVVPTAANYQNSPSALLDKTIADWDVWVQDANGCTDQIDVTVTTDPLPDNITIAGLSQCPALDGSYTFTVNVGTGMAPYKYSIGAGFVDSNVFTVHTPGTYNIVVRDANGCTIATPVPVEILAPIDLQASITALPACNVNNGVISVAATGGSGTGNYRFTLDGGAVVTADTHTFTGVTLGTHTVQVRDVATGCTDTVTLNLIAATQITGFTLAKTDVSCNGGSNGTITATLAPNAPGVNDNPVYTYELSRTIGGVTNILRPAQTASVFANLEAGDYTVRVISGRGCEAQEDVTIIQPDVIVVNAPTITQFACTSGNASNSATISVTNVTGGSSDYRSYEFFKNGISVQRSASNVYTELNYAGGSYSVSVTDSKGCTGITTAPITIDPFINLEDITVTINNAKTCIGEEDITVSATTTGGTPAQLEYRVVGTNGNAYNQNNTTGQFVGLTIGDYIITVTNPATGCSIRKVHYVNNPNTFQLQAVKTSDVICYGSATGAVDITLVDTVPTPTNEAGAFTYVVNGPTPSTGTSATAGPLSLTGLLAGNYTVSATLVNTPYCTVNTTFTIVQPAAELTLTETHTDITCVSGNNDGTITVSAAGGWNVGGATAYQYQLIKDGAEVVGYGAQYEFTALTAGNYTVNVRDTNGCIATATVVLVNPAPIAVTATPSVTMLLCNGDTTATLTASATGGQGSNYTYTLNYLSQNPVVSSGPQIDPVFANLGAGTYSITVNDGWNCTVESAPVTIAEPTEVVPSLAVTRTQTCNTLTQLTLTATGGTAPYTYSTDNVTYSAATFSSTVSFEVTPGVYHYYVKDANGCVDFISNDIEVPTLEPLVVDLNIENAKVNCTGDATGVIVAKATGGLGNYVYTLLDAGGNAVSPQPVQSTPGRFDGLVAGTYSVRVNSVDCVATSVQEVIEEPLTPLTSTGVPTPVTCNGENNGRYVVTASGGTGQIQFAISPRMDQFFNSGVFEDLEPGHYQVIVQDELGCFHINDFDITQPDILYGQVITTSIQPEVCEGDDDGAFSITVAGGVAPYSVVLDDANATYTAGVAGQVQFDFMNLSGGTHIVYIKDSMGCLSELEVILPDPVILNPTAEVTYDCVNNAAANLITVTIDASNDPAEVQYDLDGSGTFQASNVFANVAPGPHFVVAKHNNGCEKMTTIFDVAQVDPLALTLADGDMNEIVATATGGGGDYEYSFNGEPFTSNNKFIIYKSDNYTVIVRDKNGCTATVTQYFEYIDVCIPNYFTPNGDGNQDTWAPGCTNIYPDLTFVIFDRYGREVGKYRLGQGWDGKYKGAELPTGDYWYVLKLNNKKDDREFVGHFTLYR
ncbi:T9SS type B sorting domain-containing protein [Flavobacterium agrisoli]|uniref:T9SS type B sorting domain-containing protein n=1 Tax=Flavobacterium agrisoli TaxID=2793066 RepID=A0A934UJ91_9FLAO|nr:T9SS type B sorting domain-containing protein [Flavobacterium agrisoli]MBK0369662.1 T9SS type B sorting domain-containing protein [Flavobacterium agrisoli]